MTQFRVKRRSLARESDADSAYIISTNQTGTSDTGTEFTESDF
jgi:hypothetical protein